MRFQDVLMDGTVLFSLAASAVTSPPNGVKLLHDPFDDDGFVRDEAGFEVTPVGTLGADARARQVGAAGVHAFAIDDGGF